MVMYSSVADVEVDLMRTLTGNEVAKATQLLGWAGALLEQRVPHLASRLAARTLSATAVAAVSTAMVARVMRNPDGRRQGAESIDDFSSSWTIDNALSTGALYVSDDELRLLTPVAVPLTGPFVVSLGG